MHQETEDTRNAEPQERVGADAPDPAKLRRARLRAEGLCVICKRPRNLYSHHCDECYTRIRDKRRAREGMRPWHKGGRGRPPKERREHGEDSSS